MVWGRPSAGAKAEYLGMSTALAVQYGASLVHFQGTRLQAYPTVLGYGDMPSQHTNQTGAPTLYTGLDCCESPGRRRQCRVETHNKSRLATNAQRSSECGEKVVRQAYSERRGSEGVGCCYCTTLESFLDAIFLHSISFGVHHRLKSVLDTALVLQEQANKCPA